MIYDFGVQEPYKTFLLNGKKTIEGRLNKGKFKKIIVGDILILDSGEKFNILYKKTYKTFYEMIEHEAIENVLPDYDSIIEGIKDVYYNYYTTELEKQYGVISLKLELI